MANEGRVEGKVAFITGAARGQGRAHALHLAGEGADIIATDLAGPVDTVDYAPATPEDLDQTVSEVEALGRRIFSFIADIRDYDALKSGLDEGVAQLGRLNVLVANAGILNAVVPSWELEEADWQAMIDINLTGTWHACKAAVPHIVEQGPGGSIIVISSTAGLRGIPGIAHYNAAKHGVLGLARTLANELAPEKIRVNSVHPTNVRTQMIENEFSARIYRPDLNNPSFTCPQVLRAASGSRVHRRAHGGVRRPGIGEARFSLERRVATRGGGRAQQVLPSGDDQADDPREA